ncbi:carboxypeptidase regulatory-like domain-containing protein [Sphingomonas piscis]|uniref:Carboxypeptidase regulatory-like domain-containing protein n=1 Tax=Sphingomonas piscis TaxID=2714943 RepID=A0A6G7YPR0_9SPHN|nr:carboxypeptidase-like regulatory domain-containing protein [Sphingomonas piscis]QIK78717.1 carboxypeptidase regulatory-like domain-containing protein [Sphingomonas piscis]
MLGRRIRLAGWVAAAGLAASGAFAALAGTPGRDSWAADPEEQYLLDVNLRQLRLGEGVRAYSTPEGACVVLGDFLKVLDVPITVDLPAKKASGWAFREANRVNIDLGAGKVTYGASTSEMLDRQQIRETPEGWCVETNALARWMGIGVKPMTSSSVLLLESEAKLPVEMAIERERRAASLVRKASFDLMSVPKVKVPYRMWRAPALDFMVSAGVTYSATSGTRIDRRTSIAGAGELAQLSYSAQLSTDAVGRPDLLRLRTYRSDPDGGLLGPLKATHFGIGDVEGFDSRLSGTAQSGRGGIITNRPLFRPTAFGRTRFEGDLPSGWEAELYRNNELVGFSRPTENQRYVFDEVELQYGDNDIRVVLYGPQGQVRTREETINVGQENVPAGKTWYWAGFNQPGEDVIRLRGGQKMGEAVRGQAAVSVEHGLSDRMSVGAMARTMLLEDERLTFVEGTVRRAIGPAAAEVSVAYDSSGGKAIGGEIIGRIGKVNFRGEALAANNFHVRGTKAETVRDVRLAADAPLRIGRSLVPVRAGIRYSDFGNGTKQLEANTRLSTSIAHFNLATDLKYRKKTSRLGQPPPDELEWSMIGSGRVGDIRLRGISTFRILPEKRLQTVELSGYWAASEQADWEGGLVYDAERRRANARLSHIRRLDTVALAVTAEAATDRSVAVGLNLNFSLDPQRMAFSRQPLASAGSVRARVFRDLNDNGRYDDHEPLEKGALVTTGNRQTQRKTGGDGAVTIGGLAAFQPVVVGLDQSTLADPSLAPRKAMQVVTPRPGVSAYIDIPLVAAGAIEGALLKSGGLAFEGVDLELVDNAGDVVATARTDFDGFFLFDRIAYGNYRIRIAKDSAESAKLLPMVGGEVILSDDRPVTRLGGIEVSPMPIIASAAP